MSYTNISILHRSVTRIISTYLSLYAIFIPIMSKDKKLTPEEIKAIKAAKPKSEEIVKK